MLLIAVFALPTVSIPKLVLDKIMNLFKNTVDNFVKSIIRVRLPLILATTPKKSFSFTL